MIEQRQMTLYAIPWGGQQGLLSFVSPANIYREEYPVLADLITQLRSSYSNDIVPEVRYETLM